MISLVPKLQLYWIFIFILSMKLKYYWFPCLIYYFDILIFFIIIIYFPLNLTKYHLLLVCFNSISFYNCVSITYYLYFIITLAIYILTVVCFYFYYFFFLDRILQIINYLYYPKQVLSYIILYIILSN